MKDVQRTKNIKHQAKENKRKSKSSMSDDKAF